MSRIFIDRPIFAWVIAIVIMLGGLGAIFSLPIEQYPDIAPPQVNVRASYPGASARDDREQRHPDHRAAADRDRRAALFQLVSRARADRSASPPSSPRAPTPTSPRSRCRTRSPQAISRLPQQVQQQGIRVTKSNPDFLLIVAVYDATDQRTNMDVSDYLASNIQDPLSRVAGRRRRQRVRRAARDAHLAQSRAARRLPADAERRRQRAPGAEHRSRRGRGRRPAAARPARCSTRRSPRSRKLQTPEQFSDIILKTDPSGATVRLGDVARVELGADNYSIVTHVNGHPGAGIAVSLAPGADALKTAELVKAAMVQELSQNFPEGIQYAYAIDTTNFIKLSVDEVAKTLFEAIVLVILVMFVFLQNWRALLVPAIAIPVVLLGHLRGVLHRRLHDQHDDLVRPDARRRPAGRRRHRGGRECRAVAPRKSGDDAQGSDDRVDARDPGRADRDRAWCSRRCSCRWRSSAARPA